MKYEAVIFDLFGTLMKNVLQSENDKICSEMALVLKVPEREFIRLWLDTWELRATGFFTRQEESIAHVCKELGVSVSDPELEHAAQLRRDFLKPKVVPYKDATEVLDYLKMNSYKTGLITDCSADTVKYWYELPLSTLVDVPVFSCLEGLCKPDSRIYKLCTDRLEVEPDRCLYIGDGGSRELTGAAEAGMHPVLIRHYDEDSKDMYLEREDWDGTVISSLQEVLNLVE